jgi:AraC family transcriptional regulator
LAKIAVDTTCREGPLGPCEVPKTRIVAASEHWSIYQVICTAGPKDRAFEEQHSRISVAVVVGGTFQYRTSTGTELMTPGSLLLGNPGDSFQCSHEHGIGDRCISFHYSREFCELAELSRKQLFRIPRIPPLRVLAPLVASASMLRSDDSDQDRVQETALQVLHRATHVSQSFGGRSDASSPGAMARVTRVLRAIEAHPEESHRLAELAAIAKLSPYHFLRCFERLTGATPRQYVLRTRLRNAAFRLKQDSASIIEIALACGFGDVSNFNHAFRAEFGKSPRLYRDFG